MAQQKKSNDAFSSPENRRRPSAGLTCPSAPIKKKQSTSSRCRSGDDWLMQHFENNEHACPSSPMAPQDRRPQPRRQLFPAEQDHERDDQPSFEEQPRHLPRRNLFGDEGALDNNLHNVGVHPRRPQLEQEERQQNRQTRESSTVVTPPLKSSRK